MVNKFKLFDSDSLKLLHRRVFFSITIFVFIFFISIYRISSIMLFPDLIQERIQTKIEDFRGNIYDRNGNILATSIKSVSLSINPTKINNKKELLSKLSIILDIDHSILEKNYIQKKVLFGLKEISHLLNIKK